MFPKIILPVLAVLLIGTAAAGYIYGPATTALFLGKPVYIVKPSPQKYAKDALRIIEGLAINGSSEQFQHAKQDALQQVKHAESYADTHEALRSAIKVAGGKHSNLVSPENNVPGTAENSELPAVEKHGGVALAKLPSVAQGPIGQQYADTITDGLLQHAKCGAIVDLRGNDGGDMGPMLAGLSPLLPDGTALEFVSPMTTTAVTVNGNAVKGGGTALTTRGGKLAVPVAVLVDGDTASSAEATMLAFRGLNNSRSFGAPTAGYASANMMINLPDGAGLMITTAKDRDRTGAEYHEDSIQPDETATDAEAAAFAWLNAQGCS
ncbi:S41 family peptidase [Corynebacterium sp. H127]|uniref:S41 family peptidase n=1 Tax=Corynebacterium sp. H127 TaxID=3133418 RepID=UPI0030A4C3CA